VPLRLLSFVTTLCFAWSLILASTVQAAMDRPPLPMGYSRLLSMNEMSKIFGAAITQGGDGGGDTGGGGSGTGSGGTYTNPAATPGSAYPWIGSVGGVSTYTGNKTTTIPIVSWTQRGGLSVNFTLTHNSLSSRNGELGPKWLHSYDCDILVDGSGNGTVYWGNGSVCTFMKNVDGSYTAPTGIHDILHMYKTLGSNNAPGHPYYQITSKGQTAFTFSPGTAANFFRLSSISDENYNTITISYVSGTNLVQTITDATGRALTLSYIGTQLTYVVDPLNREWIFSYDGNGNLATIDLPAINGLGYAMTFGYNSSHDVTNCKDLRGNQATFFYNTDNTLQWEKDNLGNQTSFSYSASATTITDPNGHTTVQTYSANRLSSVTDALNYTEYYTYDTANNITQKQDRRGYQWNATYDGMGNTLTAKDPYSNTATYTYNAHNRPLTVTAPLGRSVAVTYDGADNPTQVQQKDAAGNVAATTNFTIGSYGLVSDKYDPNNHHTGYTYDANGNLASTTTQLGHKTSWGYDALGFQTSRTDAMGRTTTYTPDAWERLTTLTYPDSTTHTYGYDPDGNLTAFTDTIGTTNRFYDADNRLLNETQNGVRVVSHAYDAAGQKELLSTTTDYLGNAHTFTYTARNQISTASIPGQTVSYIYDANGNQTNAVNPNSIQQVNAYDAAGRLTGVTNSKLYGGTIFSFGYTYNADSQRTGSTEYDGTAVTWGYDGLGHLTSEVRSGGGAPESISYGYDAAGNRISQSGSALNGTLSYDADDELTGFTYSGASYASATFGYDANGERTTETTGLSASGGGYATQYGYDFEGNLTGITAAGNGSVSFEYDGLDRQLGWKSGGTQLDYQLDGSVPLTETNQTSSRVNLYGNGLATTGGETLLYDGLGATRQTADGNQNVLSSSAYTAFGQPLAIGGSTGNHSQWGAGSGYRSDGFGPADALPLTKVGARYYDPEFGGFLSRDTDLSQSPYAYCNGDPVNFSDPTGHDTQDDQNPNDDGCGGSGTGDGYGPSSNPGNNPNPQVPPASGGVSVPDGSGGTITVSPSGGGTISDTQNNQTITVKGLGLPTQTIGTTNIVPLGSGFNLTGTTNTNLGTGAGSQSVGLGYSGGGFNFNFFLNSNGSSNGMFIYKGSFN